MIEKILDQIIYALFLYDYERKDNDDGKKAYQEFKKLAMEEHCGDCTMEPQPCARCAYEEYFNQAKHIHNVLETMIVIDDK